MSSSNQISIQNRTPLYCAHSESVAAQPSVWRLGPLDQCVHNVVPVAVVFVYRNPDLNPSSSKSLSGSLESDFIPLSVLKMALEHTLDFYPHLTGRLQLNQTDKTPEIVKLGSGAELLSAVCSSSLDSFKSVAEGRFIVTDLPNGGNDLLAPYIPDFSQICENPLLTVQHTRFACGSVSLGIRMPHLLADADAYFQFCRDLAEIYRKVRKVGSSSVDSIALSELPCIEPYLRDLKMNEQEKAQARLFKPWLYVLPSAATNEVPLVTQPRPVVTGRVIRFSATELESLKGHAKPKGDEQAFVTTFEALAAHLHQRVFNARQSLARSLGHPENQVSTAFLAPVNQRGPNRLNLQKRYFANAVFAVFTSIPLETMEGGTLSRIARHVHDTVRLVTPEEGIQNLKWISAQPDKSAILPGFRLDQSIFMASQWNKTDMYKDMHLEYVNGEAIAVTLVSPPFTPISLVDGLTYFIPTEDQIHLPPSESSIDVCMALDDQLWKFLDDDPLFRIFQ